MLDQKKRPTAQDAEAALRTLIEYAGDDAAREGVLETPSRVVRAYGEWFAGYKQDPEDYLLKTFDEVEGYDDIVLLRDIDLVSTCEHHMAPIIGKAHIAYLPDRRIVGLSKIVRVVDALARRLQVQERLTKQIAAAIETGLKPRGVAVVIEAEHFCMRTRGVRREGVMTTTKTLTGAFHHQPERSEVLSLLLGK